MATAPAKEPPRWGISLLHISPGCRTQPRSYRWQGRQVETHHQGQQGGGGCSSGARSPGEDEGVDSAGQGPGVEKQLQPSRKPCFGPGVPELGDLSSHTGRRVAMAWSRAAWDSKSGSSSLAAGSPSSLRGHLSPGAPASSSASPQQCPAPPSRPTLAQSSASQGQGRRW